MGSFFREKMARLEGKFGVAKFMEHYKKILRDRLTEKRYEHSLKVAEKAVYLARKYGADEEKAELAGLLHDITKQTDAQEQLKLLDEAGIKLTEMELANEKLWHAISGAAYLKTVLKIEDKDILNAVRYHTTGRVGMSLLEKIIFLADMISDDRIFDGVDEARDLAEENLEMALCLSAKLSIEWLLAKRAAIAPDTLGLYNKTVKFFN